MIDHQQIIEARRALGRQLASYRKAAGYNQHQLAPLTGYVRSTIANVEVGRQNVPRAFWECCDKLLQAEDVLIRSYAQLQALIARQRREAVQLEIEAATTSVTTLAPLLTNHSGSHDEPSLAAVQSFRAADSQVGGGHLYATVVQYLQTEIAPRLFGSTSSSKGTELFSSAAALTEMAGWMAHDAGRDAVAQQHFIRALDLVRIGGDVQLSAHILGSMSHLAHQRAQPEEAIRLARTGRHALGDNYQRTQLAARLLAMEARGYAAQCEVQQCASLLLDAERVLGEEPTTPPSPWVSPFDEGSLANEAARCFLALGQLNAAHCQVDTILAMRPPARTRSRAFGQLMLAHVLVAKKRPDDACAVVRDVLDSTASLSSYLVSTQLVELGGRLAPFAASRSVAACLEQLRDVVHARQSFTQWLVAPERTS